MSRTVKVGLDVDERPFVRGVERAADATEKLDDALGDVTGSAKDTTTAIGKAKDSTEGLGGSAKDAGRDLNRLRDDAAKLDRQIDETGRSIRDLARDIAAASDEAGRAKLTEKLKVEQVKQRDQVNLRRLIDVDSGTDVGADLAEKVSLSFAARLGPLLARAPMAGANPAALAIGAPIVAGLVTLVGTAVGGAIVGAAGVGGVVGGLKLAAKDPAVQAAGTELGEDLSAMLGRASLAFVPETLDAIDTIRDRALKLEPAFTRAFNAASEYVDPLLDGLLDAGENAMPKLTKAIESADPVIDSIADGLRDIGDAVGDSFADLAPHADEGARALHLLFKAVELGIRGTTALVVGLSELYAAGEKVGAWLTGDLPTFYALATAQDGAKGSSQELTTGLGAVGRAGATAASKALDLVDALQILNGQQLTANEAEREFQSAVDDARDVFDKKVKSIDLGTERGRAYSKALDNISTTAKGSAQAIFDQSGSVEKANAKINEGRTALYNQARQYGLSEGAAWAYVNSVLSIPKEWNTDVKATDKATPTINAIKRSIATINGRTVVIAVKYETHGSAPGEHIIGQGTQLKNRWGGLYEHAQVGVLREAQIAAPVAPARYAWAEPATGGEAFIPRFGDRDRSLGILARAASWYGQQIAPAGAMPAHAGGTPEVRVFIGDQELRGMVRVEVSEHNRGLKRRVGAGAGR